MERFYSYSGKTKHREDEAGGGHMISRESIRDDRHDVGECVLTPEFLYEVRGDAAMLYQCSQFRYCQLVFLLFASFAVSCAPSRVHVHREAEYIRRLQEVGAEVNDETYVDNTEGRSVFINSGWAGSIDEFRLLSSIEITQLYISDCTITEDHVEAISRIPDLRYLDVSMANVSGRMRSRLRESCPAVTVFDAEDRREQLIELSPEELKPAEKEAVPDPLEPKSERDRIPGGII